MTKRILALTLCIVMICSSFFGCAKKDNSDPGAYITMYLTDEIYDFDPASAYYNTDAVNVLSLMYETLFKLDDKGNVKKSLVDSYEIVENPETDEYYIEFTLKEAYWSVKDQLTAEHVVFAWKRLVDFRNNFDAASLLYDVKNARAIKEGDIPVDDLGVEAVESLVVKVSFEAPIDYDQFLLNLTSVATAPLLNRYVSSNPDWAKKSSTIATSGPFKLGRIYYTETGDKEYDDNAIDKDGTLKSDNYDVKKVSYFYLERNAYYYRDTKHDSLDKSVKPYRLLVDCTKSDADLLSDFQNGKLFYMGNIPLSLRTGDQAEYIQKKAFVTDALSTFVVELNQNALIDDGESGTYLFADAAVRQALSMAIDREAVAEAIVFAQAADAFVANGIFDVGTDGEFRTSELASALISTTAKVDEAKALLAKNEIDPTRYTFSIKVAANDEVHVAMTEMICEAWNALGFNVTVQKTSAIVNNDYFDQTGSVPPDVCDDLFVESVQRGNFEAIALDVNAFTADAYSMLSGYAYAFSGGFYADAANEVYEYDTHITGYNSIEYNILMEAIYYIPYFASVDTLSSDYMKSHLETMPYEASASATMRKLAVETSAAKAALNEKAAILNPDDPTSVTTTILEETLKVISAQTTVLETAVKLAEKDILAANVYETLMYNIYAVNAEVYAKAATVRQLIATAENAVKNAKDATGDEKAETLSQALESTQAAFAAAQNLVKSSEISVSAITSAKDGASKQTLKEAIEEVYKKYDITPSTKTTDWNKQKSILLHAAEELLMKDLPVIPVVYNQNAILIHKDLSNVDATYYAPATFRKTKLKNYKNYTYYDKDEKKDISIFKSFPEIKWDMIG